jgi:hypothetical protein
MASSFSSQIPTTLYLISQLRPSTMLDIGKGFGKYGFLMHEYYGIDSASRPSPTLSLREQSRVAIDAVESNQDYLWPHLSQFYRQIFTGRIESQYQSLPHYDVILMADVIEHLKKEDALAIVRYFIGCGSTMVITTPRHFFQQELFESEDERHLSHWKVQDFRNLGYCQYQNAGPGTVFLVSSKPIDVRGFGSSPVQRLRRITRSLLDEFGF